MDRPWCLASPTHETCAHLAGGVGSHALLMLRSVSRRPWCPLIASEWYRCSTKARRAVGTTIVHQCVSPLIGGGSEAGTGTRLRSRPSALSLWLFFCRVGFRRQERRSDALTRHILLLLLKPVCTVSPSPNKGFDALIGET
jgi:hypothetical protein